jgi:hypothetical protein
LALLLENFEENEIKQKMIDKESQSLKSSADVKIDASARKEQPNFFMRLRAVSQALEQKARAIID